VQLAGRRHLEGHVGLRERALGPHDSLGHGGLRHQEGPGNLLCGEPAEQPQREGHSGLVRKHGVAGREHQTEQVVAGGVVHRGLQIRLGALAQALQLAAQLVLLALEHLAPSQPVDGAVLGRGHEPGARVVRDARLRPLLQGGHESLITRSLDTSRGKTRSS